MDVHFHGTRSLRWENDLDDCGRVGAFEREGMVTIKQEILKQWIFMEESSSALQA
jgi:hypothetical protein